MEASREEGKREGVGGRTGASDGRSVECRGVDRTSNAEQNGKSTRIVFSADSFPQVIVSKLELLFFLFFVQLIIGWVADEGKRKVIFIKIFPRGGDGIVSLYCIISVLFFVH